MKKLMNTISENINIKRYSLETDSSYYGRLVYSALGLWCITMTINKTVDQMGCTKNMSTIRLKQIYNNYKYLFPELEIYFNEDYIFEFIRKVYEETGYFINQDRVNILAPYERTVKFENGNLFFGIPGTNFNMNGLGIFSDASEFNIELEEFLVRDKLSVQDFIEKEFEFYKFNELDIEYSELEFFSPFLTSPPSKSWKNVMDSDITVCRRYKEGPYFKVIRKADKYLYCDLPFEPFEQSFYSQEFRRIYLALRSYYENPIEVTIERKDDTYSLLSLGAVIPNREYFLLLLCAWPYPNCLNRTRFIINNTLINDIIKILNHIGMKEKFI